MSSITINRKNSLRDVANLIAFVAMIIIGVLLLNSFVFRSYSVLGVSMEDTMHTGERIIVNRLPITWSQITNQAYQPQRGQIIVFENPNHSSGNQEHYLVKRVVALGGERITVSNGQITVYNRQHPDGFNPNNELKDQPRSPVSGEVDMIVPDQSIFVVGDHRDGNNSHDSRNGLGTVPIYDVIGPVVLRWWPLPSFRTF